jgi:tetratricopeptide (TPR) repeat protein
LPTSSRTPIKLAKAAQILGVAPEMTTTPAESRPVVPGWLVALLLIGAPVAVYWNSLQAPLVLDDLPVVTDNPSIRTLWPLTTPLSPPAGGLPVSSRPVVNLSFALNYAIGGESVTSYHAFNIVLHVLSALTLFGVLRRTFAQPVIPEKFRDAADALAVAVATLWAVHPLQTAAVTYISQRTELLASLCYLLTLYAFVRAVDFQGRANRPDEPGLMPRSDARLIRRIRPTLWAAVAVIACLAGMGSKETMASAPLIVLLYDRTFIAGSFAAAWRRRGRLHAALMATWLLLAWLVWHSASRGGTAGWGTTVSPAAYALTQGEAIMGYFARSVVPWPLVFDYGDYLTPVTWGAILDVALVGGLLVATLFALRRWPVAGFAGALFFAVLAPSSSVVPVATQTIADHRMYLPLAVVLVALVLGGYAWLGRRFWLVGAGAAVAFGGLTVQRNQSFASSVRLWQETVRQRPENIRARNNLAAALLEAHQTEAGLAELRTALQLKPDQPDLLRNLAQAEFQAGQVKEALTHIEQAQQIDPSSVPGWILLGEVRVRADLPELAVEAYTQARQMRPESIAASYGLGEALFLAGRNTEALTILAQLRQEAAGYRDLHLTYGAALLDAGKAEQALAEFDAALAQEPPTAKVLHLRALALLELGRRAEGAEAVRRTLEHTPEFPPAVELARELGLKEK